jgi:hypothetical protein
MRAILTPFSNKKISGEKSGAGVLAQLRTLVAAVLCAGTGIAYAGEATVNSSETLRAMYASSQARLSRNQFQRPIYLESNETSSGVSGDIYAVVMYPFATVSTALKSPKNWCDILILHLNTKYCRATTAGQGDVVNVSIGKKYDQPLEDAYRLAFAYRVAAQTSNYLQVRLSTDVGPLSTKDYRIMLEAIPLTNGQSFIHLSYSYGYGVVGRLAMKAYLATAGRNKVGFTVAGTQSNNRPLYIGGMRGLVERNTMRYYLAIEAFLAELPTPPQTQFEKRINDWFTAIERYPLQLHEMERGAYLDMKRKEYRRQQRG